MAVKPFWLQNASHNLIFRPGVEHEGFEDLKEWIGVACNVAVKRKKKRVGAGSLTSGRQICMFSRKPGGMKLIRGQSVVSLGTATVIHPR